MLDIEKEFDKFVTAPSGSSFVKDIYHIIPSLSEEQLFILHAIDKYAQKWECEDVQAWIINFKKRLIQQQKPWFYEFYEL